MGRSEHINKTKWQKTIERDVIDNGIVCHVLK